MTVKPQYITYAMPKRRRYRTATRASVEQVLAQSDFEKELARKRSWSIFLATGNFRRTTWGTSRRYPCYILIDSRRLLWIVDPLTRTIEPPRHSYAIERIC